MQVKELESLMVLHDVHIMPPSKAGRGSAMQPGSPGQDSVRSMASHRSASPATGGAGKAALGSPHSDHQAIAPSTQPFPRHAYDIKGTESGSSQERSGLPGSSSRVG